MTGDGRERDWRTEMAAADAAIDAATSEIAAEVAAMNERDRLMVLAGGQAEFERRLMAVLERRGWTQEALARVLRGLEEGSAPTHNAEPHIFCRTLPALDER